MQEDTQYQEASVSLVDASPMCPKSQILEVDAADGHAAQQVFAGSGCAEALCLVDLVASSNELELM